jgi:hypothetical protein
MLILQLELNERMKEKNNKRVIAYHLQTVKWWMALFEFVFDSRLAHSLKRIFRIPEISRQAEGKTIRFKAPIIVGFIILAN